MTQACISQQYSLSLRNQFNQSPSQQIIIFVLSPFIYLAGVINVIFFVKGRKKLQPPADILLFISVFGIFRITSYLAASIYDNTHPPQAEVEPPSSFEQLCDGTGFINVMCQLADFFYTVVFCIYYVVKIKNPLKSWIKDNKEVHFVCLVLILVGTLIFYLTDLVGISILGVCGYKIGRGLIFVDIIFTNSFFVVMVVSSVFFVKYLRSISKLDRSNRIYFKFYFKYLIISSIVYLIGVVTLFVAIVQCLNDEPSASFETLTVVCNLSRILSPVMVFLVIINHPQLRLATFLKCLKRCCNDNKKQDQEPPFYEDLMSTKRVSIMIELNSLNNNNMQELDYLSKIKDKNKACLINTILGCICLEELQSQDTTQIVRESQTDLRTNSIRFEDIKNSPSNEQTDSQIYGWNYLEKYEFELTEQVVMEYSQVFSKKLPTINLKFVSFSTSIFRRLQKSELILDLHQKMLPLKNQANIIENLSTDGGRSGQFFFFNFDKTLIIKTITSSELTVLRQRIEPYFKYFSSHKHSFIVRILGLYKAINTQTNEEICFMVMGNILKKIPKQYILKSYDMKGSTYQRQVLTKQQIVNSQNIQTKKTLKDIDFHVIQGKIHISAEDSNSIKKIIEDDVSFLCSQGLIDYSLILMKINYQKLLDEEDIKPQNLKTYNSTKQKGVVYILGIIDYLQTWNLKKKSEKWYKSIFNKGQSISSQDPKFYAQRFMKNLIMMILP